MRDATAGQTGADAPRPDQRPTAPAPDPVATAAERLARPGLVVVTGSPGAGRSSALRAVADRFGGTVFTGGGLAILRGVPGLALSRAVRARLPVEDGALTAEAVRSRVRGGLLVLDDLQWADPLTLVTLPGLAAHCRVLVSLRTPHRLPAAALAALRAACDTWLALPPLTPQQATELARRIAPGLGAAGLAEVVARAGGVPLAVETLARHAVAHPESVSRQPEPDDAGSTGAVAHAVAEALADLTRPARTAMAALGMLRRPAARTLLGAGVAELAEAGLVVAPPTTPRARRSPPCRRTWRRSRRGCSARRNGPECTAGWPSWSPTPRRPGTWPRPATTSRRTSGPSPRRPPPKRRGSAPTCCCSPADWTARTRAPRYAGTPLRRRSPSAGPAPRCVPWPMPPTPTAPCCAVRRCCSWARWTRRSPR
ncbi:hypothetical protein [Actinocatenispora sera]|uniref:Uncharacterized protein n=1 Tax=Actinocatenispora sera TaxID=390989 RepID=A0A810L8M8_9ACTN|nr:hypothetical protein [Actinocatenispora sera]BCJ30448.1 hypothetical protein Asera_45560 [Actinocatenispora sera]